MALAVETYCDWGEEARRTFALLAACLAIGSSSFHKARVSRNMFWRLNIITRAIRARNVVPIDFNKTYIHQCSCCALFILLK